MRASYLDGSIDSAKESPPAPPEGHHFFTLVATGSLPGSIFSAFRPPSVASVAGRKGGILRRF